MKERDYILKITNLEMKVSQLSSLQFERRASIDRALQPMQQPAQPMPQQQNLKLSHKSSSRENIPGEASRDEQKFCSVITKTYSDLFGIRNLKEIWKKHKEILQQWVEYNKK